MKSTMHFTIITPNNYVVQSASIDISNIKEVEGIKATILDSFCSGEAMTVINYDGVEFYIPAEVLKRSFIGFKTYSIPYS